MSTKFIMLVGLPGSGKSTIAKEMIEEKYADIIVSSDNIREQIWGTRQNQDRPDLVFDICHKIIIANLQAEKNVVFDATNLQTKNRINLIKQIKREVKNEVYFECDVLVRDMQECIELDKQREDSVGSDVIFKKAKQFQIPYYEEGWDEISLMALNKENQNFYLCCDAGLLYFYCEKEYHNCSILKDTKDFDQHCKYHNLKLDKHLLSVRDYLEKHTNNEMLLNAAIAHDYGKLDTGVPDDDGNYHYYGHAEYGAYKLLSSTITFDDDDEFNYEGRDYYNSIDFLKTDIDFYMSGIPANYMLELLFYVNYHMLPFDWESEKTKNKYRQMFGEEKFNNLMLLHEADIQGKDL